MAIGVLSLSVASVLEAAGDPAREIAEALPCGKAGVAEGVSPGADLFRIDIDLSSYPAAVCNDGTPATMFVRRYASEPDRDKWIIFLLGGGDCGRGQACADRWCSVDTNYGEDKMSTRLLRETSIAGDGIFSPAAPGNDFAGWNQVFVYYCSSDDWAGSAGPVPLSAARPDGVLVDYLIHFRGADIVEAVIGTLRRQPDRKPVRYRDGTGATRVMPDLDDAGLVVFSGSSAGGNGVKNNVDRVGELLRSTNRKSRAPGERPLVYLGVIDASYPPSYESLDLTRAAFCTGPPFLCSYRDFYANEWNEVDLGTWGARGDESCVTWHRSHEPGTEWKCADPQHVVDNHVTTPLFIRQDLQDETWGNVFLGQGLTTPVEFGELVHARLLNLADLDGSAEEGSARNGGPPLATPGVFGPQCTQHYGLSASDAFFDVRITEAGKAYSFHDVLRNWVRGSQPEQAVHFFTGVGAAPDCP